jgi:hypothetical protein
MKALGLLAGFALLAGAAFVGSSPWRVHGGRFVTEYLIAAGAIGVVGAVILFFSAR